jgi:hypothetical protein
VNEKLPLLRPDKSYVEAALVLVTDEIVQRLIERWIPLLRDTSEDDAAWDYPGKRAETCYRDGHEHVAVIHADDVQGILLTSLPDAKPAMSEWTELPVFVEYLAIAPWNRPNLKRPPDFRGIGSSLIKRAVVRSITVGRAGCIALHSEPNAVSFYADKLKLSKRGPDMAEELREFFEGDADWATKFLSGIKQ